MTVQFIDNLIYALFVIILVFVPVGIIVSIACVILDKNIKDQESNNFLGRGKK